MDILPESFLKLVTFNLVDLETAYFIGTSKLNNNEFTELFNLNSALNIPHAAALNVAIHNMVRDGLLLPSEVAQVNKVLEERVKRYLHLLGINKEFAEMFKSFIIKKSKTFKYILGNKLYDTLL